MKNKNKNKKLGISYLRDITFLASLLISKMSFAELTAMSDSELENASGQAFIKFENFRASEHAEFNSETDKDFSFTRLQFGVDIKVLLNIDKFELGKYPRPEDTVGEVRDSDILFYNYGLGHINPNGEIVPFEMRDPFFEFAYDDSDGKKDLIGFRLGFGEARGTLSNDIQHITGNIDVDLKDDHIETDVWIFPVQLNGEVTGTSKLLDPTDGTADPIRATGIGIPTGEQLDFIPDDFLGGVIGWLLGVPDGEPIGLVSGFDSPCLFSAVGPNRSLPQDIDTCFELSKYRSIPVGKKVGGPQSKKFDFAEGLFLSFQTTGDVIWGAPDEERRETVKGAFYNVPSGSVEVRFDQANDGIPRSRTEFINRGVVMGVPDARWGTTTIYEPN